MEKRTFNVSKISCGHCVATIQKELNEIEGVTQANGDPQTKSVTVEWQLPATASEIEVRLTKIGYPAST
jgi:copper chaperone CopZ